MQLLDSMGTRGRLRATALLIALVLAASTAIAAEPKVDHAAACKIGRAESCLELGNELYHGKGRKADKPKAAKAFARGCELGSGDACANHSSMALRGDGIRTDQPKGLDSADRGCTLGHASLCASLGKIWLEGSNGASKDVPRALHYLTKACSGGQPDSCSALCIGRATDEFGPRDPLAAVEACKKACGATTPGFCLRAGDLYRVDLQRPADAVAAYERGCGYSVGDACARAAALLLGGRGAAPDLPRARSNLEMGCAAGSQVCCRNREKLDALQGGAPPPPKKTR